MNLAICLPGETFSGHFMDCLMQFCGKAIAEGINIHYSRVQAPNVFSVRNMCLGGTFHLGPRQVPFSADERRNEMPYDYTLWIDSDMIFTYEDFKTLLKREKNIISGIARIQGTGTWNCCNWDLHHLINTGALPFYTDETLPKKDEPFVCDIAGFAFMLVQKGVFEQIDYPWFSPYRYTLNDCTIESGEDVGFCMKLKALGIPLWIDPTVKIGHEKMVILR